MLEQASDGILTKIADARGRNADMYVIQVPQHFEQLARELSCVAGKSMASALYSVPWATSLPSSTNPSNADDSPPPQQQSSGPQDSAAQPSTRHSPP